MASKKKVEIGPNGKVNLKWKVISYDYSTENREEIVSKFAKKYGIAKENIKVEPDIYTLDKDGNELSIGDEINNDIQNPEYQIELYKKYLNIKGIDDYDFDIIKEIDSTINNQIDYTHYEKHKKYFIKWIKWSNFMSYGEDNFFDFQNLKGLVLLTSQPSNQGGKTTFCLDLIRFLLFGKVTSRESDWTLSKAFNKHLPEATEVIVEGCVCIDGQDYVIKRVLTRPTLKKRTEKSKVSQKIDYYRLVNNEYINLSNEEEDENEKGVSTTETNKIIKDAIGNERDFDLMICIDSTNLKELISLKDTERGRLLSRWVGLLSLEEKDKIARETFNKSVLPSLLVNKYNREDIKSSIELKNDENKRLEEEIKKNKKEKKACEKKYQEYCDEKDKQLSSIHQIDNTLLKADVATVTASKERYKNEGIKKANEKKNNEIELSEIGEVKYDEEKMSKLQESHEKISISIANTRNNYRNTKNEIELLKKSEFCPTCGARLKDVDNTEKISEKEELLNNLLEKGKKEKENLDKVDSEISKAKEDKIKFDRKTRLELIIAKNEVDIENLRHKYKEASRILNEINANKEAIEINNKIETAVNLLNAKIATEKKLDITLTNTIASDEANIKLNNADIEKCNKIIEKINEEEILVKHWRMYLEMVGKNGISKMVLKNALPLINGELKRLLNDVCDFYIEVNIDDKNDVAFSLIHDGVKSNLSSGSGFEQTVSSLALRSVLSRISSFSKPSFVVFDEILGGVAKENYEQVKKLYDKIVKDYNLILQITHNNDIFDWHNKTIMVTKENNISTIKVD